MLIKGYHKKLNQPALFHLLQCTSGILLSSHKEASTRSFIRLLFTVPTYSLILFLVFHFDYRKLLSSGLHGRHLVLIIPVQKAATTLTLSTYCFNQALQLVTLLMDNTAVGNCSHLFIHSFNPSTPKPKIGSHPGSSFWTAQLA